MRPLRLAKDRIWIRFVTLIVIIAMLSQNMAWAIGQDQPQSLSSESIFKNFDKYFKTKGIDLSLESRYKIFQGFEEISRNIFSSKWQGKKELFRKDMLSNEIIKAFRGIDSDYKDYIVFHEDTIQIFSDGGGEFFSIDIDIIQADGKSFPKIIFFYDPNRPPLEYLKRLSSTWTLDDEGFAKEMGFWIVSCKVNPVEVANQLYKLKTIYVPSIRWNEILKWKVEPREKLKFRKIMSQLKTLGVNHIYGGYGDLVINAHDGTGVLILGAPSTGKTALQLTLVDRFPSDWYPGVADRVCFFSWNNQIYAGRLPDGESHTQSSREGFVKELMYSRALGKPVYPYAKEQFVPVKRVIYLKRNNRIKKPRIKNLSDAICLADFFPDKFKQLLKSPPFFFDQVEVPRGFEMEGFTKLAERLFITEVSINAALKELDAFLNQTADIQVPPHEFVGFGWEEKSPSREFIQAHLPQILDLAANEQIISHRLPDGRLRFSKLEEHFFSRENLTPPNVPCPVEGGELQIINALLNLGITIDSLFERSLIDFLLMSDEGRQWLLYSLQRLFTIDPPFKFNQIFSHTIHKGKDDQFTKLFYEALDSIDPAKAGLIVLHLLGVCEVEEFKKIYGGLLVPHINLLKQSLSRIACIWELDPKDTQYLTVFFNVKLKDRGFLEQLNLYPEEDGKTCYLANGEMGRIIEVTGDTPRNLLEIATKGLPASHLKFYFPDDLIPYIEYLLDLENFFFPFREEVVAEVEKRKSADKSVRADLDISTIGSLYGDIISRKEGACNLRDFLMDCDRIYHGKEGIAKLLPEGIVVNHRGIQVLLMPDLTKCHGWEYRRTSYKVIGFVDWDNLFLLDDENAERIALYLSSLPPTEIRHYFYVLYDELYDKKIFQELATLGRAGVYAGHDLALENEVREAISGVGGPVSIVDLGMGGGELLLRLTHRFSEDKRIRFYGTEPDKKSFQLAKIRLPGYVKVSNVPAENLSRADFYGDLEGTYNIAVLEGVIAYGVTKLSNGQEILGELFRMGFDKIFITGNTPVNLNFEELQPILQKFGYLLERTLYPQNLFNHNQPKIMFVLCRVNKEKIDSGMSGKVRRGNHRKEINPHLAGWLKQITNFIFFHGFVMIINIFTWILLLLREGVPDGKIRSEKDKNIGKLKRLRDMILAKVKEQAGYIIKGYINLAMEYIKSNDSERLNKAKGCLDIAYGIYQKFQDVVGVKEKRGAFLIFIKELGIQVPYIDSIRVREIIHEIGTPITNICINFEIIGGIINENSEFNEMKPLVENLKDAFFKFRENPTNLDLSLADISGILDILDSIKIDSWTAKDEKEKETLEKLKSSIKKSIKMARWLIDSYKKEEDVIEDVDINDVLRETLELTKLDISRANIETSLNLSKDLSLVRINKYRLKQVFINLIQNAVDAINAKEEKRDMKISVRTILDKSNKEVKIEISDTGIGIPKKDLGNIFKRFYTTKTEGRGLGLSISKEIIEEYGGRIEVEGRGREGGATFRIYLPYKSTTKSLPILGFLLISFLGYLLISGYLSLNSLFFIISILVLGIMNYSGNPVVEQSQHLAGDSMDNGVAFINLLAIKELLRHMDVRQQYYKQKQYSFIPLFGLAPAVTGLFGFLGALLWMDYCGWWIYSFVRNKFLPLYFNIIKNTLNKILANVFLFVKGDCVDGRLEYQVAHAGSCHDMSRNVFVPKESYLDAISRRGLISLDSKGDISPSISTMRTGWFGSFCVWPILSLHWLKSVLPLMWNIICVLSRILSSISGWASTYLLNSAERVRCNSQKYSSLTISYLLQKATTINLPIFIQVFIGKAQRILVIKTRYTYLFCLSAMMYYITVSKSMSGIISNHWIPMSLQHNFQLDNKLHYFIFITIMLMAFTTIGAVWSNKVFDFNLHRNNIYILIKDVKIFILTFAGLFGFLGALSWADFCGFWVYRKEIIEYIKMYLYRLKILKGEVRYGKDKNIENLKRLRDMILEKVKELNGKRPVVVRVLGQPDTGKSFLAGLLEEGVGNIKGKDIMVYDDEDILQKSILDSILDSSYKLVILCGVVGKYVANEDVDINVLVKADILTQRDNFRENILDRIQGEGNDKLNIDRDRINRMIDEMFNIVEKELGLRDIKQDLSRKLPEIPELKIYGKSSGLFSKGEELGVNREALFILQEMGINSNIIEYLITIGIFYNQIIGNLYGKRIGAREKIKSLRQKLNEYIARNYRIDLINMVYGLGLLFRCNDLFNIPPVDVKRIISLLETFFTELKDRKDKLGRDLTKRVMVLVLSLIRDGVVPRDSRGITRALLYYRQFFEKGGSSSKKDTRAPIYMFYAPGIEYIRGDVRVPDLVILSKGSMRGDKGWGMEFIKTRRCWSGYTQEDIFGLIEECILNAQYREENTWIYKKTKEDACFYIAIVRNGFVLSFNKVKSKKLNLYASGMCSYMGSFRIYDILNYYDKLDEMQKIHIPQDGSKVRREVFWDKENKQIYVVDKKRGYCIILDMEGNFIGFYKDRIMQKGFINITGMIMEPKVADVPETAIGKIQLDKIEIVHEIKNLLSAVLLNYELIEGIIEGEKEKEIIRSIIEGINIRIQDMDLYLEYIRDLINRLDLINIDRWKARDRKDEAELLKLKNLIKDSLKTARKILNAYGQMVEEEVSILDINNILREVLNLMKPMIDKSNIQISYHEESKGPPLVSINKDLLKQVFINIIKNAIESVETKGGGEISISTSLRKGHGKIIVQISDTGIGICREDLERIFKDIYTTKPSGTGIGLIISKGIIERYGGKIVVKSRGSGEGALFRVTLPYYSNVDFPFIETRVLSLIKNGSSGSDIAVNVRESGYRYHGTYTISNKRYLFWSTYDIENRLIGFITEYEISENTAESKYPGKIIREWEDIRNISMKIQEGEWDWFYRQLGKKIKGVDIEGHFPMNGYFIDIQEAFPRAFWSGISYMENILNKSWFSVYIAGFVLFFTRDVFYDSQKLKNLRLVSLVYLDGLFSTINAPSLDSGCIEGIFKIISESTKDIRIEDRINTLTILNEFLSKYLLEDTGLGYMGDVVELIRRYTDWTVSVFKSDIPSAYKTWRVFTILIFSFLIKDSNDLDLLVNEYNECLGEMKNRQVDLATVLFFTMKYLLDNEEGFKEIFSSISERLDLLDTGGDNLEKFITAIADVMGFTYGKESLVKLLRIVYIDKEANLNTFLRAVELIKVISVNLSKDVLIAGGVFNLIKDTDNVSDLCNELEDYLKKISKGQYGCCGILHCGLVREIYKDRFISFADWETALNPSNDGQRITIDLIPVKASTQLDKDLLHCDFFGDFLEAGKGSLFRIGVYVEDCMEGPGLFIINNQPGKAYWRLPSNIRALIDKLNILALKRIIEIAERLGFRMIIVPTPEWASSFFIKNTMREPTGIAMQFYGKGLFEKKLGFSLEYGRNIFKSKYEGSNIKFWVKRIEKDEGESGLYSFMPLFGSIPVVGLFGFLSTLLWSEYYGWLGYAKDIIEYIREKYLRKGKLLAKLTMPLIPMYSWDRIEGLITKLIKISSRVSIPEDWFPENISGVIAQDIEDVFNIKELRKLHDRNRVEFSNLAPGLKYWLNSMKVDGVKLCFIVRDRSITDIVIQLLKDYLDTDFGRVYIVRDLEDIKEENIVYLGSSLDIDELKRKKIKFIIKNDTGLPLELNWCLIMLGLKAYNNDGTLTNDVISAYIGFVDKLAEADLINKSEAKEIIDEVYRDCYIKLPSIKRIKEILEELSRYGLYIDMSI